MSSGSTSDDDFLVPSKRGVKAEDLEDPPAHQGPIERELLLQILWRLGRIEEQLEMRGPQVAPSREGRSLEDMLNELIDGMGRIERAVSNMPRPSAGQAKPEVDPEIARMHESLARIAAWQKKREEEWARWMNQPDFQPSSKRLPKPKQDT